jgi:hypothetical protein
MMQASRRDLENLSSPNYDSTWQTISMMYNSVKSHKNNEIVSRRDQFPVSADSEQVKRVNDLFKRVMPGIGAGGF